MNIIQPSRISFWRFFLFIISLLPFLSIWQSINLARTLEIDIPARTSWMGLIAGLCVLGLIPLLAWTLTWSRFEERLLALIESPEHLIKKFPFIGWILIVISTTGFTAVFMFPPVRNLFGGEVWIRLLIFWYFSLTGLYAIRTIWRETAWFTSFLAIVLFQTTFHLLAVQFSHVTSYPFAMGWSETSRYYYPSLFLSKMVYGQEYSLPILHPTLHLLLAPPYLVSAPLWVHRFWQVTIRLILVGAIVPGMMKRLSTQEKPTRSLVTLGMLLYLFMGPLYFHLAVPVIILMYGFSNDENRKTWIVVLFASIWCGWSRVNWYPVPGMIAALLYLLEVPFNGKSVWGYLVKPALWFMVGASTAFISQRIYIAISGVPPELFYTSLSSDLLWYRLFPNASYQLGILPSVVLASFSIWLVIYLVLRGRVNNFHPVRLLFIFAALLVLFLGGLVVSLKIGGGADLHNMDAYFVLLLILAGYLVFGRYRREDGKSDQPVKLHWGIIVLLVIMPVWSQIGSNAGPREYDVSRTDTVLADLQSRVDEVDARGGELLFITQRHLISMNMLKNVTLVPEYEREDLMEMAMGNNTEYMGRFQRDLKAQRFDIIVVDPLNYSIYARRRAFSDENNVWVKNVMEHILCNYQVDVVYPDDEIALYVPQSGEQQCP